MSNLKKNCKNKSDENTWEPDRNLNCDRLLADFKFNRKYFNVEEILDKKIKDGAPYYLIKWENYSRLIYLFLLTCI